MQHIAVGAGHQGRTPVPILVLTAHALDEFRVRCDAAGCTDFLTKPVDHVEFSVRVRNMLALSNSHKKLADRAAWLADEVAKATMAIHAREQELLYRMSRAAEFRDPETGAHIQRMAHYSRLIAARLGLPDEDQQLLFQAAPMHDVGKIGIPDHILLKPGRLTADEFEVMKTHTILGCNAITRAERDSSSSVAFLSQAKEIARWHHERWDGKGYPDGLAGESIPVSARLMAMADVFDALISRRVYKEAIAFEQARQIITAGQGQQFDPDVAEAFLAHWEEFEAIALHYGLDC